MKRTTFLGGILTGVLVRPRPAAAQPPSPPGSRVDGGQLTTPERVKKLEAQVAELQAGRTQFEDEVRQLLGRRTDALQQRQSESEQRTQAALRSAVPAGTILMRAAHAPVLEGFLLCDGTLYDTSRADAAHLKDLLRAIGSTWGGDGVSTFAVPDLRGAFPRFYNAPGAGGTRRSVGGIEVDAGRTLGELQAPATALPGAPFVVEKAGQHTHSMQSAGKHTHTYREWRHTVSTGTGPYGDGLTTNPSKRPSVETSDGGAHFHALDTAGEHTHILTGGDPETRPINVALVGYIRY
jgi:microcystin-dependent protein